MKTSRRLRTTGVRAPRTSEGDGPDPVDVTPFRAALIESIYRQEHSRLTRALRRRLRNPEDAADVLHDAFVRLAGARPLGTLQAPVAYLQRIVRNLLYDRGKRAEHQILVRDIAVGEAHAPIEPPNQSWRIEAQDLMRDYSAALDALPTRTRDVFILHRVEELRYRDIAERLGISVATVEYHMARALAHLAKALYG